MKKLYWGEIGRTALRVFGYLVIFGFIGFMFTPALVGASAAIRIPVIGALVAAGIMLVFVDGSFRGERDSAMSEMLDKHSAKGDYKASEKELAKRYSPPKGILGALLGGLPLLLIALYVALTAQPYAYSLQDLPSWLNSYMSRPEIGGAVQYPTAGPAPVALTDYLRVGVRFMLFPYVGLFGTMSDALSLMFYRISPLFAMILPVSSAVGYLFGPRRRAKYVKSIETAKRTPKKRLKKDRQRQQGPKEKKQLV